MNCITGGLEGSQEPLLKRQVHEVSVCAKWHEIDAKFGITDLGTSCNTVDRGPMVLYRISRGGGAGILLSECG